MNNALLIFLLVIIIIILCMPRDEYFSASGLSMSDFDCRKLADVYYRPKVTSPKCRNNYRERICGHMRRNTIDPWTGNYFTDYGTLI